ncbi:MAG: hypothetical protein ACKOA8_05205 [Deltaproteobacteria bacterium]
MRKYNLTSRVFLSLLVCGLLTLKSYGATQEEKYVYESSLTTGLEFQAYHVKYNDYFWNDTTKLKTEGYGFNLGLEWIPLVSVFGKVAASTGIGFATIKDADVSTSSTATLYNVPVNAGLTYRADFFKNQVLVPFTSFGLDFGFSTQASKTGDTRGGVRLYKGYYYSAGVELCLNSFDSRSGRELDSRYGINGVYFTGLFFHSEPLSKTETVNLGHEEFRVGLRFEI